MTIERPPLYIYSAEGLANNPPFIVDGIDIFGCADKLGIDQDVKRKTGELLTSLYVFDETTALDSVRTLPVALTVGELMGDYFGTDPETLASYLADVWAADLLHDVGKTLVGDDLIIKSNQGHEWTAGDRERMKMHVVYGGEILRAAGFPASIVRPVEEHHGKQLFHTYGVAPELTYQERFVRDAVAIADFVDAMLRRNNTRNAGYTYGDRVRECVADTQCVADDYKANDSICDHELARWLLSGLQQHGMLVIDQTAHEPFALLPAA